MSAQTRAAALLLSTALLACQTTTAPLAVADDVDLDRYMGHWYEIASFPQRFQRGCVATTATYSRRNDGRVRVVNACRDKALDGPLRSIEGVAWVTDPDGSSAKLKVQFFWPFSGDYWIVELDSEYRYAVVGHPSREYLWILSRTPTMEPLIYRALLQRIAVQGFDVDQLSRTLQPTS